MAMEQLIAAIPGMVEKGGLPAVIGGGLMFLVWKFGGRREDPEAKLAAAFNALADEVRKSNVAFGERLVRVETKIENLEGKK